MSPLVLDPPAGAAKDASPIKAIQVELRPGCVCEVKIRGGEVPKYCLAKLTKRADGTYFLGVVEWHTQVRMSEHLCESLGLPLDYNTLYRLAKSGLIAASEPTPGRYVVDLADIAEHIRRTSIKPGQVSWWTPERIEAYRCAR